MGYVIGFDLGGTYIKFVAVDEDGAALCKGTLPTGAGGEAAAFWVETIRSKIAAIEARLGEPLGIGVACPGLAARDGRSISWMQGRMEAVQGLDWTAALGRPSSQAIPVLNDAQAALLGEAWCGAAEGHRDAAILTLGTGVGGACILGGELLKGKLGRAGHFGHMCLNPYGAADIVQTPGSLELEIGECTIAERTSNRFHTTIELVEAYVTGDSFASDVWLRSVHALGCAIVSLINVLDPEVFVIGGGIAQAGSPLFDPLREVLDRYEWRPSGSGVKLVPALLGEYSGAYGAAADALNSPAFLAD